VFSDPKALRILSFGVLWKIHYIGIAIASLAMADLPNLRLLALPRGVGVGVEGWKIPAFYSHGYCPGNSALLRLSHSPQVPLAPQHTKRHHLGG
jgi:hypothetical protein